MSNLFRMIRLFVAVEVVLVLLLVDLDGSHGKILGKVRREVPSERWVVVRNNSGRTFDIMWVDTLTKNVSDDKKYVSNTEDGEGVPYGGDQTLTTYVGHEFEIWELPSKSTGECKYNTCRKLYFTITTEENQEIHVTKDFTLERTDNLQKVKDQANDIITECHTTLVDKYKDSDSNYELLLDKLDECIHQQLNSTLEQKKEEQIFESTLRQRMAKQLPTYSCYDMNFTSTKETHNRTFRNTNNKNKYEEEYLVQVLHENSNKSHISMLPYFAKDQECQYLKQQIQQTSTVEATGSTSTVQKASIPWSVLDGKSTEASVLHQLMTKLYHYGRVVLEWDDLDVDDIKHSIEGHSLFDVYSYIGPKDDDHEENKNGTDDENERMRCTSRTTSSTTDNHDDEKANANDEEEEVCYMVDNDENVATIRNVLPMTASTSKSTTESIAITDSNILGQIFLFCDDNDPTTTETTTKMDNVGNGGIQFPQAGIHINPQPEMLVFAKYRGITDSTDEDDNNPFDGFTQEYYLCPPQNVYIHTFVRKEKH